MSALAEPIYQPPGTNLTYGHVSQGQRVNSALNNPAAAALLVQRGGNRFNWGGGASITAGIEYGDVQELFDTIDELSKAFAPSDPDGPDDPVDGVVTPENPKEPIDIGQIVDTNLPNFDQITDDVKTEVVRRAAILALIATEGYAKAFASVDAPFIFATNESKGAWTFGVNFSGTSKAFGVVDPIDFDAAQYLEDLKNAYDPSPTPDDEPRLYDLSGDVNLFIDPSTGDYAINLDNDSAMLSKAARTLEISLGYSWHMQKMAEGDLYLGVEGKLYDLALSRLSFRFGDITDSEEVFDAIRDSDFEYDQNVGLDLGLLWARDRYQLGATLTNVNEPEFKYPGIDLSVYSSRRIIDLLERDRVYTMERQLRLEASYFTENRRWSVNLGLDANAVEDPVGDDFRWLTVSAGYTTKSWWLPGVRFGYRQNLAGTELRHVGFGVTAFQILNVDIASSLDDVRIDGETLPQSVLLSIGVNFDF